MTRRRPLNKLRRVLGDAVPASPGAETAQVADTEPATAAQEPATTPARPDVRATVAAGARLRAGLAWEWRQIDLQPGSVSSALAEKPDLVLIEISDGSVPGLPDTDAAAAVEAARDSGIPVVVWVTGGSPSALGRRLAEAAATVFVADADAVPSFEAAWPAAQVAHLAPAAAPRLHNPVTGGPGTRRLPRACIVVDEPAPYNALGSLLASAIKPLPSLDVDVITTVPAAGLPAPLAGRAKEMRVEAVDREIGRYSVVVDAGRREAWSWWVIAAAAAAQTAVVSRPEALSSLPAEIAQFVPAADDPKALRSELTARIRQPELRDRQGLQLHRNMLDAHTFGHRVERILDAAGVLLHQRSRSVSAVVPTNRPHQINNVLANVGRQSHPDVELVLVLHGLEVDRAELEVQARDAGVGHLKVVEAGKELTLGACMNLGVDAAEGEFVAKMDDDNYYGRHYLRDLLHAFEYTDAGIVGKWAHYVWLRSSGAVVLRYPDAEHTYERRIQGGSMLFAGSVVRGVRFGDLPRAVDSDILDRAAADGVRIYSADRFNYISIRGIDRTSHTWTVADSTFMTATGRLVFFGDPRRHVEV